MAEDYEGALAGQHLYVYAGVFGELRRPDACGEDDLPCADLFFGAFTMSEHLDAHYPAVFLDERSDRVELEYFRPVADGVDYIGVREAERVHGSIGHFNSSDEPGIHRRFQTNGFLGGYSFGFYAGGKAAFYEILLIFKAVLGEGYEKASAGFHAVGGDAPQDLILPDALLCAFPVGYGIAPAAVKQAVVAATGAIADVATLHQERPQTAHGAVAGSGRSRNTTTHYDNIVLFNHQKDFNP